MSINASLPRLDWLRAFATFAEYRNFTHAARALGLSQPALHTQVKHLEEALETPLYRRDGRTLHLTEAGERVVGYANEVLGSMRSFVSEVRTGRDQRPVTLTAGEGAYLYLLGPSLEAFRRDHPEHPLRLLSEDRDTALESVRSGRADVAVTALAAAPTEAALEADLLSVVGISLAFRSDHPGLCDGGALSLDEVANAPLIAPPAGRPMRRLLEGAWLEHTGRPPEVAVEASGWPLMLEFVRLGLGVAFVNAFCAPPPGVALRPVHDLEPVSYWMLWRRRSTPASATVEALRRALARTSR